MDCDRYTTGARPLPWCDHGAITGHGDSRGHRAITRPAIQTIGHLATDTILSQPTSITSFIPDYLLNPAPAPAPATALYSLYKGDVTSRSNYPGLLMAEILS